MTTKYSKLYISVKFRLHGLSFFRALEALEMGKNIHNGFRKDGVTPEFQHQLEITLFIMTLKDIQNLEDCIICALLHDGPEDYPHEFPGGEMINRFGHSVWNTLQFLDKNRVSESMYFVNLGNDLNGSIVKLCDRINNFQSMNRGKFTIEKQMRYRDEVVNHFLPMAKQARKNFPRQMDAYYNIETMLKNQLELINLFIEAKKENINE